MIRHYLTWPLLFVLCFILQTSFVPSIAVAGIKPDLLMLVLFFFAIRYGVMAGVLAGFLIGLLQDVYTPVLLGQNALTKTVVGACIGLFNEKVMRTDPFVKTIILFLMFLINDALFMLVLIVKNTHHFSNLFPELLVKTIPRAIYSIIIAALFYIGDFFPKATGKNP